MLCPNFGQFFALGKPGRGGAVLRVRKLMGVLLRHPATSGSRLVVPCQTDTPAGGRGTITRCRLSERSGELSWTMTSATDVYGFAVWWEAGFGEGLTLLIDEILDGRGTSP